MEIETMKKCKQCSKGLNVFLNYEDNVSLRTFQPVISDLKHTTFLDKLRVRSRSRPNKHRQDRAHAP